MLIFGELDGIRKAQSLAQGHEVVTSVSAEQLDPANEGKLVHITGPAQTKEVLTDRDFDISVNAIRLTRKVEMYQWQEKESRSGRNTTYSYDGVWSNKPISSRSFHHKEWYKNPEIMPFMDQIWQAKEVTCGAFVLAPSLIDKIQNDERLPAESASQGQAPAAFKPSGGLFYMGADPARPKVGDVRVEFKVAKPETISVIARQSKDGLEPYTTPNGQTLDIVYAGAYDANAMFELTELYQTVITWVLRVLSFGFLTVGLVLVGLPTARHARSIPVIGPFFGLGGICFGLAMGPAVTLFISGLLLLGHAPLFSVPLLLIAVALVALLCMLGARRNARGAVSPGTHGL